MPSPELGASRPSSHLIIAANITHSYFWPFQNRSPTAEYIRALLRRSCELSYHLRAFVIQVIQYYPSAAHSTGRVCLTYKVAKLRGGGWRVRILLSTCSILGLEKVCSDYYPSHCKPTSLCMLGQSVGRQRHTTPQRSRGSHLGPGWLFTISYLLIRLASNIRFAELFWESRMWRP